MTAAAEWVQISKLRPWDKNPRKNDAAVQRVADSIRRFGFGAPLVVRQASNIIIAGHTRYKAAKLLGLQTVPVRFLDISESDAELLALADNKLGEIAEWDEGALASMLSERSFADAGFAGWSGKELGAMADAIIGAPTVAKSLEESALDFERFEIVVSGPLEAQLAVTEALNGIDGITIEAKS